MSRESEIKQIIEDYEYCKGVNDAITIGKLRAELRGILEERKRIQSLIEERKVLHGYYADDKCLVCIEYDYLLRVLSGGRQLMIPKHSAVVKQRELRGRR